MGSIYATLIGEFYTLFRIQVQDKVSLDIKKREDQALISISTILKFSAQV